jgi:hypothetical protein
MRVYTLMKEKKEKGPHSFVEGYLTAKKDAGHCMVVSLFGVDVS